MRRWIEIVSMMKEPFDYEEYVFRMAVVPNGEVLSLSIYGQQVGLLMLAYQRYPRLQPQKAYDKLTDEIRPARSTPAVIEQVKRKGGCGGCSGSRN